MAKNKRLPIGKTLRFEVFKRDLFKCQYCGANPNTSVLEIDHILPVSKGGDNNILNLITSCFDCNRGKRDNLLSFNIKQTENLELIVEKEKQYLEYRKFLKSIERRINKEINEVSEVFTEDTGYIIQDKFKQVSLKNFINKLGSVVVKECMFIALSKGLKPEATIKYFCGVCYNKIRDNDDRI